MSDKQNLKKTQSYIAFGLISVFIAFLLVLILVNLFLQVVPLPKLQGLPLVAPLFIAPFGIICALVSTKMKNNKLAQAGLIANIVLFICPTAYNIIVTIFFGP
ncbi:MAG: hypothetical protein GX660_22210 [Clostridiaceae bacterium]|nr:hypothetical protein [Clostridiaceae bacterium]